MPVTAVDGVGKKYLIKLIGAGEGHISAISEWIAGHLALLAGLPVLTPRLFMVDSSTKTCVTTDEFYDVLKRSGGVNTGFDFIEGANPYSEESHAGIFPVEMLHGIFLFDIFMLNIDRHKNNTNAIVSSGRLYSIDYGVSLLVKCLLTNTDFTGNEAVYRELRRNPFYEEDIDPEPWLKRLSSIGRSDISKVISEIPNEWMLALGVDPALMKPMLLEKLFELINTPDYVLNTLEKLKKTDLPGDEELAKKRRINLQKFRETLKQKNL